MVHFKYPSVKDYLCTTLTRHVTSFSKGLKHFMYVQTMLFAINQAVSCKPLSRKVQVQSQASPSGNCGGKVAVGLAFLQILPSFPPSSNATNSPFSFIHRH